MKRLCISSLSLCLFLSLSLSLFLPLSLYLSLSVYIYIPLSLCRFYTYANIYYSLSNNYLRTYVQRLCASHVCLCATYVQPVCDAKCVLE